MKLACVLLVAASFFTENLALPVGNEGREDVVTRCLVEVLSKALSKPDSHTLDQECKDILKAGVKHGPLDKKSGEEVLAHEEEVKGELPEANAADVKDIEALLKSVEEKRQNPEDERSQESWGLDEEKRSNWRAGRHHQRKHKRDEDEEDNERSQEYWGFDDDKEKRSNWRAGRHHQRKHKRDEGEEEDTERSQESWSLDKRADEEGEDRDKKNWRPGRYHQRRQRKRDEELSEEQRDEPEEEEERSQESWSLDKRAEEEGEDRDKRNWRPGRVHQRKHKRDEEPDEEEGDTERSQEAWGLDEDRDKRSWRPGRFHQRKHKRDEELDEEVRDEPEEERSQESWDFDKRHAKDEEEGAIEKRIWKPTHRYHHKKKYHKRGEDSASEEDEEPRSDEEARDKDREEALRYLTDKRNEVLAEGDALEKRNPWIYRGFYHPAWYKRNTDGQTTASQKEKELDSLTAMDMELQKIAAKLHENRSD